MAHEEEALIKYRGTCLSTSTRYLPTEEDAYASTSVFEDYLWPNGKVLKYGFIEPFPGTDNEQSKVKKVIKEWERFANIRFVPVDDLDDSAIRISFNPSLGSWSYVGKIAHEGAPADQATMNLGWLDKTDTLTEDDRGVILHQFGHALGLDHEHQASARNGAYKIDREYTIDAFSVEPNNLGAQDVEDQILNVYENQDLNNYVEVDLDSVMSYFMPAEQNEKRSEVKVKNQLSDHDKSFMLIHYPYFGYAPREKDWTFARALDIMGLQGDRRKEILRLYSNGNVRDVRREFAKHCIATRETRKQTL